MGYKASSRISPTPSGILPSFDSDGGVLQFYSAAHAIGVLKSIEDSPMHASMAFVNGAGETRRNQAGRRLVDSLTLLNTLLAAPSAEKPALDRRKPKEERQAEDESKAPTISRPGGFENDPPDPKNPNEVRERHQRKVRP
jgi:hypothetical protein